MFFFCLFQIDNYFIIKNYMIVYLRLSDYTVEVYLISGRKNFFRSDDEAYFCF